jgi:gas vesicle structural protein
VTPAEDASRALETSPREPKRLEEVDDARLVLSDLLNRVLDRGLVITGSVTLAVADVDLVQLDLKLVLSAVESAMRRSTRIGGV